jgi:phage repressor protein C with HTH and peptisase S24 domain
MGLGDRILKALNDAGISQAEIARRFGITPQAVNGWITTNTISKKNLARLAEETGTPLEVLMTEREEQRVAEQNAAAEYMPRRPMFARRGANLGIPVRGYAVCNPVEDGYYDDMGFPPGAGDEYIPWPTKDPNAYAIRVRGNSMEDRIRHGELIVIEPGSQVSVNDDVIVQTVAGRKMVKRLRDKRANEVTLGSINQAYKDLTISMEEIESIHRIAAILPRGTYTKDL